MTPKEMAPLLEKKEGAAKMLLWRMAEKGLLVSEGGAYGVAGRGSGGLPPAAPAASPEQPEAAEKGPMDRERSGEE